VIISIKGLHDVYTFINKAQAVDGDVTVRRGRYNVDGKSIMGIFSVDMSQDVTVIYPYSPNRLPEYIKQ
jgi:phosphotransferase system HPr-like phosphotransfer protein